MKGSVIITVLCIGSMLSGCAVGRHSNLGVRDGRLTPCPDRPNCVSSQSIDAAHYVAPLMYSETAADAFTVLKKIIERMDRTMIVEETATYLHIEVASALFGFVDDVEFFVDDTEKKIHVRSASRLGYSDLGVNRRRVERIRQAWEQRQGPRSYDR